MRIANPATANRIPSSQTPPSEDLPIKSLSIYSPARSIENILLLSEIRRSIHFPCKLIVCPSQQQASDLLLFDCCELSTERIHFWLGHMQKTQKQRRCVLLNVTPQSLYEQLIEWPQVQGLFYRSYGVKQIILGLQKMLSGHLWLPRHLCQAFLLQQRRPPQHRSPCAPPIKLTPREQQMLDAIYAGHSNNTIAKNLNLSEHTIKSHLYSTYKKLGVKTRLEASNWLRENYTPA